MSTELREAEEWDRRLAETPRPSAETVKLEFHLAPLGWDCWVSVNGATVERIQSLDIHSAYNDMTTFILRGIMADGTECHFGGRLAPDDAPEGGG